MGQIAKIIKSYFTENRFLILLVLSLITFATKYILNYWALDKGIISSDEGLYMILQDRMVVDVGTHEHLIFGLLPFTNDIF